MKKTIVLAILIVVIGPSLNYAYRYGKRKIAQDDMLDCTAHLIGMYNFPKNHNGWFPTSADGCLAALSKFVTDTGTACIPESFATNEGTNRKKQRLQMEKFGNLSAEICPYAYVQGLKLGDPSDFIMIYRKTKTHWRLSCDFWKGYEDTPGWLTTSPMPTITHWGLDSGGWLNDKQLADRLEKTLKFIENEKRLYWEQTIKEHRPFLEKLRKEIADAASGAP